MTELAEIVAGWPLAASLAATVAAQGLRSGRRRTAVNEALHELRRPLQAIALASGPGTGSAGAVHSSVRLAAVALERLECEVNGESPRERAGAVDLHRTVEAAVRRWQARASLGGGTISLRWRIGGAIVAGDRAALAQALDNLLVNAIEHGGPTIAVAAHRQAEKVRIVIADSGRLARPASRRGTPAETIARLSGRRRRGHGLAVVRRVAASHGGRFVLRRSERGTEAMLELPLTGEPSEIAA